MAATDFDTVRSELLRAYSVLGTPPEKALDDLVALAAQICDTPLAFITFLDGDQLWFKSAYGTEASQIPVEKSLCRFALDHEGVYIIPDLVKSGLKVGHCESSTPPDYGFYAGIRLAGPDNIAIGTLCVIDDHPRDLTSHQITALECLAKQIMTHLELRRTVRILDEERRERDRLLEFAGIHQWRYDFQTNCVQATQKLLDIFGLPPDSNEAIPLTQFVEAIHEEDRAAVRESNRKALESGSSHGVEFRLIGVDGVTRWFSGRSLPDFDSQGNQIGQLGVTVDITRLKEAHNDRVATQARLQKVFEQMPARVCYWDKDLILRFANQDFASWLNRNVSEMIGRHRDQILPQEVLETSTGYVDGVLQGEIQSFEKLTTQEDGEALLHNYTYVPDIRDGEIQGFFVLGVERTELWKSRLQDEKRQAFLKPVLEAMPVGISYWDCNLRNQFANSSMLKLLGKTEDEVVGQNFQQVLGRKLSAKNMRRVGAALNGRVQQFERMFDSSVGGRRDLIVRYVPDFLDGQVAGFYAIVYDITAQREAEHSLQEEKERARVTLNAIADAVITTDCGGLITYMNPKAEKMTGWSADAAKGTHLREVLVLISPLSNQEKVDPFSYVDDAYTTSCTVVDRDGWQYQAEETASRLLDPSGNEVGKVIVLHDVSEERAMASRMAHLARHDALTNLPNRLLLMERLDQAMNAARTYGGSFALVFLDVDHFKNINDSVGHAVGDGLLRAIAERLSQSVKACDTVCRMGGDEFILLLSGIDSADQATFLVQQIVRSITVPYQVLTGDGADFKLSVTASAGVAMFPDDGSDRDTLMRRADVAMYLAKQAGRNRYQFFSTDLDQEVLIRHSWLQDMREAIDGGEFQVFYQPKISTRDRSVVGVEALVRWQRSNGEIISPGEFIPLAEKSGLMVEIGAQVLFESCRQYARWEELGLIPVPVSVNVSAVQLASHEFLSYVASVLEQTGIRPDHLELEITESTLMVDVDKAALVLYQLKELGVKISLDDFGTGYSSLSYLRRFPLDCIKIDRSFVSDLTTNSSTAAIMKTICNLGKTLNLQIVAEGVETEAQAQLISNLNCDAMQGYLFSKPVRPEFITRMLPYDSNFMAKAA